MSHIMEELDKWVSKRGSGHYIPADYSSDVVGYGMPEEFGIQQERNEIKNFVALLEQTPDMNNCLEIGLGYFGSTHFIWRQIFQKVQTVEYQKERVFAFRENMTDFYGQHVLGDGKSAFFFGKSNDVDVLLKVKNDLKATTETGMVDMLFIDGDHLYKSVLADWLLYKSFVRPGGLIVFHDAVSQIQGAGVFELLKELRAGTLDGKKYDIQEIVSSKDCGIAYYVND